MKVNKASFKTERLTCREVQISDLDDLYYLHTLPEVAKYNTYDLHTKLSETEEMLQAWLLDQEAEQQLNYVFAIKLKKEFVGIIVIATAARSKWRLGTAWYLLLPKFWGKGIATEALEGLLKFAFTELKLHRIEAGAAVAHPASLRVLEKVGMKREGHKRKVLPLKSGWSDNYEHAILEDDWFEMHPSS